jgi:hypothetical protein
MRRLGVHTPWLPVGSRVCSSGGHDFKRAANGTKINAALAAKVHRVYGISTFSKNSSARGSLDCPNQNIACLRTSGFLFVCAT